MKTLIGGLQIAMKALAGKMGVNLLIQGDTAYTDGNTIVIPTLPDGNEDAALFARGYTDHEAGHCRFTDFSVPMDTWTNLVEDVRIENEQGKQFPGCRVNLKLLAERLKEDGDTFRGSPKEPVSLLMSWAVCRGRHTVLGQDLDDIAVAAEAGSREAFGDFFCDRFEALVEEIGFCRATADSKRLAEEIKDLILNPPVPPTPPPPPAPSDTDGEGEAETEESGEEGGSGDGGGERGDDGSSSGAASDTGDSTNQGSGAGNGEGKAPTPEQLAAIANLKNADLDAAAKPFDLGKVLSELLEGEHQEGVASGTIEDIPETYASIGGHGAGDQQQVSADFGFDEARRKTSKMRSQLAGLFQAVQLQRENARHTGTRIDASAVHRIAAATPDTRFFTTRRLHQGENTAICILLDRSSSMEGSKMLVALQASFVTAESVELLSGVTCSVGAFPWSFHGVCELKRFGQKPVPSSFGISAYGGTPIASALMWAGMRLTHVPQTRKIVIVMTDGDPDDGNYDYPQTSRAVERLRGCGIEIYGIGIVDTKILNWLSDASVITSIDQLPSALIRLLKEALVGRRKAA